MSTQIPRKSPSKGRGTSWESPEGIFMGVVAVLILSSLGIPAMIPQVRASVAEWSAPVISWVHDHRPASIDDIPVQPEGSERGYSSAAFGGAVRGHLAVALPEAWQSGASSWTKDERVAFVHDPDLVLPAGADRCTVAGRVVQVKYSYRLSMDAREAAAVRSDLTKC